MMRSRAELSQADECVKKDIVAASVVIVLCSSMHLTGLVHHRFACSLSAGSDC